MLLTRKTGLIESAANARRISQFRLSKPERSRDSFDLQWSTRRANAGVPLWGVGLMIVEPDFLDHWKTLRLIELTNDSAAPLMLIRLWGHCQTRRCWQFPSALAVSGICRWKANPQDLVNILVELKFLDQVGEVLVVHDFEFTNHRLISCWTNGAKGGRPILYKRKPKSTLGVTQPKVGENPSNLVLSSHILSGKCSEEEAVSYCKQRGLQKEDGEWFFHKCEGCGWTNGGKPIKNWRSTIIAWSKIRIFPSQKPQKNETKPWQRPRPPDPQEEKNEREMRESRERLKEFWAKKGIEFPT